jgi:hypothetical protein
MVEAIVANIQGAINSVVVGPSYALRMVVVIDAI